MLRPEIALAMNNVPPPPPPYVPPSGLYPDVPGQPPPPRGGGTGKCFLIGCLVVPACLVVGVAAIVLFVFGAIRSSTPYKEGVARAKADPRVARALGTPIDEPFFVTGQIDFVNSDGKADVTATLSGPKGKGELTVVGTRSDGIWSYSRIRVRVHGTDEHIDLLDRSR